MPSWTGKFGNLLCVSRLLTSRRWIRYVIIEAIDIDGILLVQSKLVQTIHPNHDTKLFLAKQEWLDNNVPAFNDADDDVHNLGSGPLSYISKEQG